MAAEARVRSVGLCYEIAPHLGGPYTDEEILARAKGHVNHLRPLVRRGLQAINNPEIVRYSKGAVEQRNGDVRKLARFVADGLGVEATVSKNVAYLPSEAAFKGYLEETVPDSGIRNLTFVGGSHGYITYPGPSVVRAIELARRRATDHDVRLGGITMFHRRDEARRMFAKTKAGAEYFHSQLAFDINDTIKTLRAYGKLCAEEKVQPATVHVSVAPLLREEDVGTYRRLLKDETWLLPQSVVDTIMREDEIGRVRETIANADRILQPTLHHVRNVPLGVHVEEIKDYNAHAALEIATHFSSVLRYLHAVQN